PMQALEQLGLTLEMLANLRLHARHVVRMDEEPPFGHLLVLAVAEHRTPARREIHRVVANVVVPETVVRGVRHEPVALLDGQQIFSEPNALDAARAAHADQLQREMKIRAPVRVRRRAADAEHAAEPLADIEADDEKRRDVEARELLGIVALRERRIPRIRDLEQPEMLEASANPRKLRQLAVLQHLG